MHDRRFPGGPGFLRDPRRVAALEPERVVDLCLGGIAPASVLDVGTGSGLFAGVFARRGLTAAGVDVRPDMVDAARQNVPEGEFRLAPAEVLPYPDGAFDLVFMGVVLHEADDRLKALGEAARVARLRIAVLEWPYEDASYGPPRRHRLTEEQIGGWALQLGFLKVDVTRLEHTVLFLMDR